MTVGLRAIDRHGYWDDLDHLCIVAGRALYYSRRMDLKLTGRVALVTGSAKGIGAAVARAFAREGAMAVIVDRDAPAGSALQQELAASGHEARFIRADLDSAEQCQRAVAETLSVRDRIDVLVNNAGFNDAVSLYDAPDAFMKSIQANLLHVFAITHHCAPHLMRRRGTIVNVGSKVSVTGQGSTSGYAAAKGGVNALTREWAVALAGHGVRVNAVLPAECHSDQYERWFAAQTDPEKARRDIEELIPLGRRLTTPEEVADTIVFLASERSSHTTGQIVFVDGGYTHLDRAYSPAGVRWSRASRVGES